MTRILIPVLNEDFRSQIESISELVKAETNVKNIELITDTEGIVNKKAKPNFKTLGRRLGKHMKDAAAIISALDQRAISKIEKENKFNLEIDGEMFELDMEDFEIVSEDIPGWQVAQDGPLTVALDITLTPELLNEGLSKEIVSRIQGMRKDQDFGVTDRINVRIENNPEVAACIKEFNEYISKEVLAKTIELVDAMEGEKTELREGLEIGLQVQKIEVE